MQLKFFFLAAVVILISCAKGEEEAATCEDNNTTKVTFSNTTNAALRVVVSSTLTPQLDPINPILTLDLAAQTSVTKEFTAGRYVNTWYSGCPSNCTRQTYNFKDFNQCGEYEEKR